MNDLVEKTVADFLGAAREIQWDNRNSRSVITRLAE